jgi:hypothetical protein
LPRDPIFFVQTFEVFRAAVAFRPREQVSQELRVDAVDAVASERISLAGVLLFFFVDHPAKAARKSRN